MNWRSPWIKHGLLNTFEHGITRTADALTSLVLLWVLSPEVFSRLAMAQAVIAPLLFFFVSPEVILYRDYALWKKRGPVEMGSRIRSFRIFGYGKAQLALAISFLAAFLFSDFGYWDSFWSLIWAFSLVLAPQISGADREYLRLSLKLRMLSFLTIYQKLVLFIGTVLIVSLFKGQIAPLAGVAAFSALSTAFIARIGVNQFLLEEGATSASLRGREGPSIGMVLTEALTGFSIWQHFQGVILNWIQTMDLFFLGVFKFPLREIGLYAAVLKLVNFSIFIPMALSNGFGIWVGRRLAQDNPKREQVEVRRFSFLLLAGVVAQFILFIVIGPFLIKLISHGRWNVDEQSHMVTWFGWILLGSALFSTTLLVSRWLEVRTKVSRMFRLVYLPWGISALILYAFATMMATPAGNITLVAQMNGVVSLIYCLLLMRYSREKSR